MDVLVTPRLTLEPITLALVEAVFDGSRARLEDLARAKLPAAWPGRALVERAFCASLEVLRAHPERLWGDRLMITRPEATPDAPERLVVGSVIFHRGDDGELEIGYGVEESWQCRGLASEATAAAVSWALAQKDVQRVTATTPPWHVASIRVLEKAGLVRRGVEEHEALGEVVRFST